jgi:subtilisin
MFFVSTAFAAPDEKTPVIVGFKGLPDAALIHAFGGQITYEYSIIPAIACSLPAQAVNALQKNPNVAYVEEDAVVQATEYNNGGPQEDWGVIKIGANVVHQTNKGTNIRIAVIDTGINRLHADLKNNYVTGYDFVNKDSDPMDDNGHGTHCSGIIAAEINGIAVVGVAPEADLYAYKVLNSRGSGTISNIIAGIQAALSAKVQVISMSLGSTSYSQSFYDACFVAKSSNVVVVAAAGNSGNTASGSSVNYPAKYDCVIAVGATDVNDGLASFSSTGPEVDVVAPGVNILSDIKDVTPYDGLNQDTGTMSGTSMACPHVAGTVALMLAVNSKLTPTQIETILETKAVDLGDTGVDNLHGYGRIDAVKAVAQASVEIPASSMPIHVVNIDTQLKPASRNTYATATVTIADASNVVQGALVTGQWTINGVKADSDTGYTDANGQVTLQSNNVRNAQPGTTFVFTVTGVFKPGCIYSLS